jgi:hypothetical protein
VVGNVFALMPDVYGFFDLNKYQGTVSESYLKVSLFYLVLFVFYIVSNDPVIKKNDGLNVSKDYFYFLLFIGSLLLVYFIVVYIVSYLNVYPLRNVSRVAAFGAHVTLINSPFKYGIFLNIAIFFVFISLILPGRRQLLKYISFGIVFLILIVDYTHGGRAISIKFLILLYLAYVINTGRVGLKYFFFFSVLLATLGLIQRGGGAVGFEKIYIFFGEFILTRVTTDVVLSLNLTGALMQPIQCFIFSILPGVVASFFEVQTCFLGGLIKDSTGLTFGLASNIVTESIYFFGNLYLLSAFFIGFYFWVVNKYATRLGFLGFMFLIFLIISTQDLVRTSFYNYGLIFIYLLGSYLLVFSFLFFRKRIFKK